MLDRISSFLSDPGGLTAHGFCLFWDPGLIWAYALSDAAIGVAYFAIPVALAWIARQRRDLVYRPVFLLFAAFILLCGTTHWLDVLTLWVPAYRLEAVVKVATAIASLVTTFVLWRLLPRALSMPSPAQWRAANDALAIGEARFRASFEQSPVPLYVVDESHVLTAVSDTWLGLLGYARSDVIGRPIEAFHAVGAPSLTGSAREALMRDGQIIDEAREFARADGTVVDALVSARVDRHSVPPSIVCVLVDVTAKVRAEKALLVAEDSLRQAQKMEAIGQLTGGIAHDFNNILQAIGGFLALIERRAVQGRPADVVRHAESAQRSVERAASLTHRMLSFARKQSLQPCEVDPVALVRGMAEMIHRSVGSAVVLRLDVEDGVWSARCDSNQLEGSVLNLAINARDAMPDGGTLTLSISDRSLSPDELVDQPGSIPGDYVEIVVADTGEGIAPESLPRVFEPFYTTKAIGRGTGLGLSQVHGFVRQSGGFLRLESQVGVGTTVRLYLPRDHAAGASADPSSAGAVPFPVATAEWRSSGGAAGRTVLLVEDEDAVRALLAEALLDIGCEVLQAKDGIAGLDFVRSSASIDLVLTDYGLPGLNGLRLAEAARAARPEVPVIIMSGFTDGSLDVSALGSSVPLVIKPVDLDAIVGRIESMLHAAAHHEVRSDASMAVVAR